MGNVFAYINADGLGDFGYQGNWIDETSPYVFGPPGPTDIAMVQAVGSINGTANVSELALIGAYGVLTSTLEFTTQSLVLEGSVVLSVPYYSNILTEVEEAGSSAVTLNYGNLYISSVAAGAASGTVFDVGANKGDQSIFDMTGVGTRVVALQGNTVIGDNGNGSVTISSGALLEDLGDVVIGNNAGSDGSVTVTGQSSVLETTGNLYGGNGIATLSVLSGGVVKCGGYLSMSVYDDGGGAILVSGAGSQLFAPEAYIAASHLPGGSGGSYLTIANSGFAEFGTLNMGYYDGHDNTGTLVVESGGHLETGFPSPYDTGVGFRMGDLGPFVTYTGSVLTATIIGAGSTLDNRGDFVIGTVSIATLSISNGAAVRTTEPTTDGAVLGQSVGSMGTVSVSEGSTFAVSSDLVIGDAGTGSLLMASGSTVTAGSLEMGINDNGYVNLSGTNTKLTVSGSAELGSASPASVIISSGGQLSVGGTAELKNGYISLYGGEVLASTLKLDVGQSLGGYGTVQASSIINSTTVAAGSGTLSFIGGITGTGTLQIDLGATLSLGSSVGSGQETVFESATSKLVLGAPASFASTIYDFIKGDTIDLSKIIASSLTYSGQALTVHESNGASLALKFAGHYSQSNFAMASDGHSGTFITHT